MKLELKHLAPYLPYGLKMELLDYPLGKHIRTLELDCGHDFNYYLEQDKVRPILRPLSDLTKEIEVDGDKFIPFHKVYEQIGGGYTSFESFSKSQLGNWLYTPSIALAYYCVVNLFQWHFDVFSLIPEGLAIDINTLN